MTIDSAYYPVPYSTDGDTVYRFHTESEGEGAIQVWHIDTVGTRTQLTLDVDYTLEWDDSENPTFVGGEANLIAAVAPGETISIERRTPIVQLLDPAPEDKFPAEAFENMIDRICFIQQEIEGHFCDCRDEQTALPFCRFYACDALSSQIVATGAAAMWPMSDAWQSQYCVDVLNGRDLIHTTDPTQNPWEWRTEDLLDSCEGASSFSRVDGLGSDVKSDANAIWMGGTHTFTMGGIAKLRTNHQDGRLYYTQWDFQTLNNQRFQATLQYAATGELQVHLFFADYEEDPVISDSWTLSSGVFLTEEEVYGVAFTGSKSGSNYTVYVYVDFVEVFSVTQDLGGVLDDIPIPGTTDAEYSRYIHIMSDGGACRQQHNFYYTEVVPPSTWTALKDGYDTNYIGYQDPDPCVPGPGSPACKVYACDAFEFVALSISDIEGFWRLDEATDVITAADASPNGHDLIDNLGDFNGTPHGVAPSMMDTCVDSTWLFYDDNFGFLEDGFPDYLSENFTWGVVLGALTGTSGQLLYHEIKGLTAEGKIELVKSGDNLDLEINNSVVGTWTNLFTGWTDGDHLMLMFNNTAGSADIYVNFVKFGTSVTFTTIAPTITPGRLWIFREFAAKAQQMFYYSKLLTETDIVRLTDGFAQNDPDYVDPNPQCRPV